MVTMNNRSMSLMLMTFKDFPVDKCVGNVEIKPSKRWEKKLLVMV